MKSQFIFNLGLPRTGTTSLHVAMLLLGVPAAHRPMGLSKIFFENKIEKLLDLPFLAYSDLPIPNYYQEIHTFFPEAKFIMTVRNVESWLTSIENFYSTRPPAANGISGRDLLRIATFGMTKFHAGRFERIYRMHSESVRDYFINSKANYLELNEVAFNDWAPICNFFRSKYAGCGVSKNLQPKHWKILCGSIRKVCMTPNRN